MNLFLGLFLLFLLVDYVLLLLIYALGIILGYLVFKATGQQVIFMHGLPLGYIYVYGWVILIGCIFSRRKEILDKERIQTLKSLAGAVAHEMRTPLLSITMKADRLKAMLAKLTEEYRKNADKKLSDKDLVSMNKIPEEIEKTTRQAFGFIDLTLMNLKENFEDSKISMCSIKACVEEALKDYPLSAREKSLIHVRLEMDFEFRGNPILMKHVFFNLMKNCIYYVKAANKGEIILTAYREEGVNILSFKDTGTGIAPNILPYIFDKFYSRTRYGTGIGLDFCKSVMKSLGGDIICRSIYGEYTEFILTFPPLENA